MNNDQLKYIADSAKMVATAQFGYYGYTALQSGDRFWVILSAILFINIIDRKSKRLNSSHVRQHRMPSSA